MWIVRFSSEKCRRGIELSRNLMQVSGTHRLSRGQASDRLLADPNASRELGLRQAKALHLISEAGSVKHYHQLQHELSLRHFRLAVDLITANVVTTCSVMWESAAFVSLERAIEQIGSQRALARLLNISQQAVSGWVKRRSPLPPKHVLAVEIATGISRHELRPDIYPIEEQPMPGPPPGGAPAEPTQRSAGVPESLKGLQP